MGHTFTGADVLRNQAIERRPVFWDANAGGWCWQLPDRAPVQAASWQAAWDAWKVARQPVELRKLDVLPIPAPPADLSPLRRLGRWFVS